ncbi:MAG: hypothetical protein NTW52_08585 [Planctomycetota bacterium]|nr:hypothetical protein [Planctomycetota bacterium]
MTQEPFSIKSARSDHKSVSADQGMNVLSRVLGTMTLMALPVVGCWYLDKYFRTGFLIWIGFAVGSLIGCVGYYLIVRLAGIEMNRELKDGRTFRKLDDEEQPTDGDKE